MRLLLSAYAAVVLAGCNIALDLDRFEFPADGGDDDGATGEEPAGSGGHAAHGSGGSDSGGTGGGDGDDDDASMEEGTVVPDNRGDRCGLGADPEVISGTATLEVDTTGNENDVSSDVAACTGSAPEGNDRFFLLSVGGVGEVWHFHIRPLSAGERDPLIYLLGENCDARSCGESANSCNDRGDEHFTFVPEEEGVWFLAVDDRFEGGGRYELTSTRLVCGDGNKEHGEICDDNNNVDGDGCDARCRTELEDEAAMESEQNNDIHEANVLLLSARGSGEIRSITGVNGGGCDDDFFALEADEGTTVRLAFAGSGCDTAGLLDLRLESTSGAVLATATAEDGECPTLEAPVPRDDEYYVRIAGGDELVPYVIEAQVLPP